MQPAFFNHPGPDFHFPGNVLMISSNSTRACVILLLRLPVSGLNVTPPMLFRTGKIIHFQMETTYE
ncbi:hypothetical protein DOH76_26395 [Salmonella enterica subsp. enterica serovar Oranienburg]|nr:hypothetical protein [Salmonella enterica]EBQ9991909.1 hypothetical protein [Salmonella enterica subsp. enterica serovar Oranienburg]EBV5495468.1 hypothetical protein [Salmonella enterica subsp. enterica serovar Newport]ECI3889869.1 hypothetical protein [Salmonella enterica subsp. enterica serovar Gombe]EBI7018168.1 hypothetical protein [Salmonella enterica]